MGWCVGTSGRLKRCALLLAAWTLGFNAFHISRAIGQESPAAQNPPATAAQGGANAGASQTPPDLDQGKRAFAQNCSQCHGIDASGGNGPSLRGVPAALGDSAVQGIIRGGIAGTAMPASTTLSGREITNIVAYLKSLGSATTSAPIPGDPHSGEALYNSSGCSTCHMIAGQGGNIGPELTKIGTMRGAPNLKARLLDPGANLPKVGDNPFGNSWTQYMMFKAIEKDGQVIEGVRVTEDSFSIVLKDASGKYHGLWKPDLRSIEKEPGKSFMPSFKGTLSDAQLDDLVAYLMTLNGAQ